MGAGRWRIVQQLLVEGIVLAGLGAAASLVALRWTSGLLIGFAPPSELPIHLDVAVDATVVWFTAAVAIATVLLFALVPAAQAGARGCGDHAARCGRGGPRIRPPPAPPRAGGRAGRLVDCAPRRRRLVPPQPEPGRAHDARVPGRGCRGGLARSVLGRLHAGRRAGLLRARARSGALDAGSRVRVAQPAHSTWVHRRRASPTSPSKAIPSRTTIRRASASTTSVRTTPPP